MTPRRACLLLAAVMLAACGGAAHDEALAMSKILSAGQAAFAGANAAEKDLATAAGAWADNIIRGGAGKGAQLEQNAGAATDLAASAEQVSSQLGQLRKAIYDQPLREEFNQGVRSTLITQITKQQRALQDLRTALTEAAAQFRELQRTRDYKGESYPTAVDKIGPLAQSCRAPTDFLGQALSALKEKYGV